MVRVRYSFGSRHTGRLQNINKQRVKYPDQVMDLIKTCDIILEVLDSRFIEETRNIELEEKILSESKKIIYVLNKSDLVDTLKLKEDLKLRPYVFISCKKRLGGAKLRNMIKRIAKETELPGSMQRVQVGIIGYPNTGKSSLLNLLVGKTSAKIGNEAGFTKGIQKVKLSSNILILDSPGVIPNEDYSMEISKKISKHTKLGARSFGKVKDPEFVIQDLLNEKESREKLEKFYSVDSKKDSELFLEEVGKSKNFLKKGGVIDFDKTARQILKDWQNGLIN